MGRPSDWDGIRDGLHRVVSAVDSEAIAITPATDWATSLQQLASQISEGSTLVGYSMGARIALGLAVAYPQQFNGLVFISGNPGLESENARLERWQADQQLATRIEGLESVASRQQFLEAWYQQGVFASVPENVRVEEIHRKLNSEFEMWAGILRTYSVGQQPSYWPDLGGVSGPVCVVSGEEDEKYRQIAVRIGEKNAGVVVQLVPDCGHIVHRERPDTLIELIADFVATLP